MWQDFGGKGLYTDLGRLPVSRGGARCLQLRSRRIVGWPMATTLATRLVLDALNMALLTRRPQGVIHHSDQGSQAGLKWSSQHFNGGVAMTRRRRRSDRSGRAPLFSPGRPVVAARDEQRRFWAAIAAGMASEDAALQAGMSQAVGTRLFRKAGGMPPAMFRPSAKPLSGPVSLICGAGGDRTSSSARLLHARGCAPARTSSFNDLAGAAAQRFDPKRQLGVSRDHGAVACRAICSPPKAGEACAQPGIANPCGGTIGRGRCRSKWGSCAWPRCVLERPPAWAAEASAVGKRLEPRADCSPPAGRLPGR